jgi:hypothetical protein
MDSYESSSSIPNLDEDYEEVDHEQEVQTPPPLDLYGVLNVSKEVLFSPYRINEKTVIYFSFFK